MEQTNSKDVLESVEADSSHYSQFYGMLGQKRAIYSIVKVFFSASILLQNTALKENKNN